MAELGKINKLAIVRDHDAGIYLDADNLGEILLPNRWVPKNCSPGDEIEVFLYLDSEDRKIATTDFPYAEVDEFAVLKVAGINQIGAFLDWGLPKDLLVPFREQQVEMEEGKSYLVRIYLDVASERLVASSKVSKFLDQTLPEYKEEQEVDLLIAHETEIGYRVVVNGEHWGMLYKNEIFRPVQRGERVKGFVKKIREDRKVDVTLQAKASVQVDATSQAIFDTLEAHGGYLLVTDKSTPEEIKDLFQVSKKTFKKAIGALYKAKKILLEEKGIRISE